jgi:hypothetical protein
MHKMSDVNDLANQFELAFSSSNANNGNNNDDSGESKDIIKPMVSDSFKQYRSRMISSLSMEELKNLENKEEIIVEQDKYAKLLEDKFKALQAKYDSKETKVKDSLIKQVNLNLSGNGPQQKSQINDDFCFSNSQEEKKRRFMSRGGSGWDASVDSDDDEKVAKLFVTIQRDMAQALKSLACKQEGPKQINPTQKTFAGNANESVDSWLYSINLNLEAANIPEDRKLIQVAGYLSGAAQQFYAQCRREYPNLNWQTFQEKLVKRFKPENFQSILYNKLNELRQNGPLAKHLEKFTKQFK